MAEFIIPPIDKKNLSKLELIKLLPINDRKAFFNSLTPEETVDLLHDIKIIGRPDQQLPQGNWDTTLFLAGRGFGKTFVGAHAVQHWAQTPNTRIGIVAANSKELRDVIVKGPSGILQQAHPNFKPIFTEGRNILEWPNGSIALLYSAESPEALRGPQSHYFWIDELYKFRYQDALWDQVQFSLRLGEHPQCIVTSTPRPTDLLKTTQKDPMTVIIRGSTFANRHLSRKYLQKIMDKYGNTRLGRQELYGEVLDDNPDALFHYEDINNNRVDERPLDLDRVVVAIDPAVTANEKSDLTGIVVAGKYNKTKETPMKGYVLADRSLKGSPQEWATAAISAYHQFNADAIVVEVNNGGDMCKAVIHNIDANIPVKMVRATRGKVIRAEPIAALYEQQRIHHVGTHQYLEDQMLSFNPQLGTAQKSPDRLDALVWGITELMGDGGMLSISQSRFGT